MGTAGAGGSNGHEDFLESCRKARCCGEPLGCPRQVTSFVVALCDPGQGFHRFAPLVLSATCRRHRRRVRRIAVEQEAVPWLGIGSATVDQLPEVIAWFYGDSGLYQGRAISVITPGMGRDPAAPVRRTPVTKRVAVTLWPVQRRVLKVLDRFRAV